MLVETDDTATCSFGGAAPHCADTVSAAIKPHQCDQDRVEGSIQRTAWAIAVSSTVDRFETNNRTE
jgi:hypothetical protein